MNYISSQNSHKEIACEKEGRLLETGIAYIKEQQNLPRAFQVIQEKLESLNLKLENKIGKYSTFEIAHQIHRLEDRIRKEPLNEGEKNQITELISFLEKILKEKSDHSNKEVTQEIVTEIEEAMKSYSNSLLEFFEMEHIINIIQEANESKRGAYDRNLIITSLIRGSRTNMIMSILLKKDPEEIRASNLFKSKGGNEKSATFSHEIKSEILTKKYHGFSGLELWNISETLLLENDLDGYLLKRYLISENVKGIEEVLTRKNIKFAKNQ